MTEFYFQRLFDNTFSLVLSLSFVQVQDGTLHTFRYKSILGAVKDIYRTEGIKGYYQGLLPAIYGSSLSWGFYFYFYEKAKQRMIRNNSTTVTTIDNPHPSTSVTTTGNTKEYKLSTWQHMYAAWEGGSITCLFTNPFWLIKTRMQLQKSSSHASSLTVTPNDPKIIPYRGMYDAFRTIIKNEGPVGLYRGLVPALFLTSHGMVQFGVYEKLKVSVPLPTDTQTLSVYYFVFGAISKAAAVTVTYPYQVIKARMQQRFFDEETFRINNNTTTTNTTTGPSTNVYRGMISTIQYIWKQEGVLGYYKGFAANLFRVAPQSAITLLAYEQIKKFLDK